MALVVHGGGTTTWGTKTGFGQRVHAANDMMKGNRQNPSLWSFGHTSQADLNARDRKFQVEPLCHPNGEIVLRNTGIDNIPGIDSMDSVFDSVYWKPENVASAQ